MDDKPTPLELVRANAVGLVVAHHRDSRRALRQAFNEAVARNPEAQLMLEPIVVEGVRRLDLLAQRGPWAI